MTKFLQGKYKPTHPEKYIGDLSDVVFRSSWELSMFKFLDNNPNIVHWGSEPFHINYLSPIDNRVHKYYVDLFVEMKKKDGTIEKMLVEIKPLAQTKPPNKPKKQTRRYITEVATYAVNLKKWEAAEAFCKKHGWTFKIITEVDLGIK